MNFHFEATKPWTIYCTKAVGKKGRRLATWQFTVHFIPRTKLVLLFGQVPDSLDPETFDSTDWWKEQVCQHYESSVGSFLKERRSWSESIKAWGEEDGDRLNLLFEEGHIVEMEVRIDVRTLNMDFLENVCSFAKRCDCLLFTEELALIEPEVDLLLHEIGRSNASAFVASPIGFLDRLRRQHES